MKKFLLVLVLMVLGLCNFAHSATTWYCPEGSTQSSFDLWILVTNPNSSAVTVKYTFYTSNGAVTYYDSSSSYCSISANSRSSLSLKWLSQQSGYESLQNQPISTKVECTNGYSIYVERSMYWDAGGVTWAGGHASRAVSGLEGCYTEISQPASQTNFPIVISQPGSYKLVGNITCSVADIPAIRITTSKVMLDLNGFYVVGPGQNSGDLYNGDGISVLGSSGNELYDVVIKNGFISDFGRNGVYFEYTNNFLITDIFSSNNKTGISIFLTTKGGGIIEKCHVLNNTTDSAGINVQSWSQYCVVRDNVVSVGSFGIYIGFFCNYNRIERNHCTHGLWVNGTHNICINNSTDTNGISDGNTTSITNQGNVTL